MVRKIIEIDAGAGTSKALVTYVGPNELALLQRLGPKTYELTLNFFKENSPFPSTSKLRSEDPFQVYACAQHSKLSGHVGNWVTWCCAKSPFVEVKQTVWGAGLGLFVASEISEAWSRFTFVENGTVYLKAKTLVSFYGGVLYYYTDWMSMKNRQSFSSIPNRFHYGFRISNDFLIDAWDYQRFLINDTAHYANHAGARFCNAGLRLEYNSHLAPCIVTLEPIKLGEEIKVHYSEFYDYVFGVRSPHSEEDGDRSSDEDFLCDPL